MLRSLELAVRDASGYRSQLRTCARNKLMCKTFWFQVLQGMVVTREINVNLVLFKYLLL